jgi:hypothetical protein
MGIWMQVSVFQDIRIAGERGSMAAAGAVDMYEGLSGN